MNMKYHPCKKCRYFETDEIETRAGLDLTLYICTLHQDTIAVIRCEQYDEVDYSKFPGVKTEIKIGFSHESPAKAGGMN